MRVDLEKPVGGKFGLARREGGNGGEADRGQGLHDIGRDAVPGRREHGERLVPEKLVEPLPSGGDFLDHYGERPVRFELGFLLIARCMVGVPPSMRQHEGGGGAQALRELGRRRLRNDRQMQRRLEPAGEFEQLLQRRRGGDGVVVAPPDRQDQAFVAPAYKLSGSRGQRHWRASRSSARMRLVRAAPSNCKPSALKRPRWIAAEAAAARFCGVRSSSAIRP